MVNCQGYEVEDNGIFYSCITVVTLSLYNKYFQGSLNQQILKDFVDCLLCRRWYACVGYIQWF